MRNGSTCVCVQSTQHQQLLQFKDFQVKLHKTELQTTHNDCDNWKANTLVKQYYKVEHTQRENHKGFWQVDKLQNHAITGPQEVWRLMAPTPLKLVCSNQNSEVAFLLLLALKFLDFLSASRISPQMGVLMLSHNCAAEKPWPSQAVQQHRKF